MAKTKEIKQNLNNLQKELMTLKLDHRIGKLKDMSQIRRKKTEIAQVLTHMQAEKLSTAHAVVASSSKRVQQDKQEE